MADRYELAFLRQALTATGVEEETALVNLLFQRLLAGNFTISSAGVVSFQFSGLFGDGLVGTPSITFTNEPTTGRYRIGAGNVGESLLGSLVFDWSATRLQMGAIHLTWAFDNTKDIGASGANRPRDFFLGRNALIGGTLGVTGAVTLTTVLGSSSGGTGSAFFAISGPTALRTFALPDASATVLTTNAAVTVAQGGTALASGTSGGVLAFTGATTLASSGALPANDLVIGGGAGAVPTTLGTKAANTFLAGPISGASAIMAARALDPLDLSPTFVAVTSQFDKAATTTLGNITGLSFTLLAGQTYRFRLVLHITADTTGGVKLDFNGGTATVTTFSASSVLNCAANATFPSMNHVTTLSSLLLNIALANATQCVVVDGYIVVNAGGTLIPRFAQSSASGTSSVLVGSTMEMY